MTPAATVVAAALASAWLAVPNARAELIVAGQLSGVSDHYTLHRLDDRNGSYIGGMKALNEGWTALCLGPDGHAYAAANVLGSGVIHEFGPDGSHLRELAGMGMVYGLAFGPDGHLYASGYVDPFNPARDAGVVKFDSRDGKSLGVFLLSGRGDSAVLTEPAFGPDGHFYALSVEGVVRHNGRTGARMGIVVPVGRGGLVEPAAMAFGPDDHIFVTCAAGNSVIQFDGATGAFIRVLVPPGSGGLNRPSDLTFADGVLYVASQGSNQILLYDSETGDHLGAFRGGGMITSPKRILFSGKPQKTPTAPAHSPLR